MCNLFSLTNWQGCTPPSLSRVMTHFPGSDGCRENRRRMMDIWWGETMSRPEQRGNWDSSATSIRCSDKMSHTSAHPSQDFLERAAHFLSRAGLLCIPKASVAAHHLSWPNTVTTRAPGFLYICIKHTLVSSSHQLAIIFMTRKPAEHETACKWWALLSGN